MCIIVLGNNYTPTASTIANDLAKIVFGEKYEIPKLSKPLMLIGGTRRYVGRYPVWSQTFVPNGSYNIERKGDELVVSNPGAYATLVPQTETEFFDRPLLVDHCFCEDNEGKVTHFLWRFGAQDYRADR